MWSFDKAYMIVLQKLTRETHASYIDPQGVSPYLILKSD